MNAEDPLFELRQHQTLLLEIISTSSAEDILRQFHPDLSPLGWHLGHCVFTETYWVREVVMGDNIINDEQKQLYIPELSVKSDRSSALPGHAELCDWAVEMQRRNIECLNELINRGNDAKLMQDNYLVFFLGQHYAQHIETANYVLAQRKLQLDSRFQVSAPLQALPLANDFNALPAGEYSIGARNPLRHYDNECRAFTVGLDTFEIASSPLSNAEFLGFMQDGGYRNEEYWSDEGRQWRSENNVTGPQHWRRDADANLYGTDANGPYTLQADAAVSGLSYFEAQALASWANAALPHEYQWEAAKKAGLLSNCGQVWEWCRNSLHPYRGFAAFPYDGYSLPWFDDRHFTLRGHSLYTLPVILRDSFRNFYEADKRHFPAGLRFLKQ